MSAQQPSKPRAWRYLTWGFAALGVAAAGAVIFLAVMVLGFMSAGQREPARVAGKAPSTKYSIQDVQDVRGTDLIRIEIGIGSGERNPYSSGGGSIDQRNLILLDRLSGASRKLLADNDRRIERSWFLPAVAEARPGGNDEAVDDSPGEKKVPPPFAYYVLAVRQAQGLSLDLLVGDIASGSQAFVLTGIDGIDKIWMLSPTRVALLLREKLRLHYRVIDIPTLKVVTARPVDIG